MTPAQLERYLHEHIPLSRAMQVRVADADPISVCLDAPLAPNINHRETVFGGSASALAILAAWSLLHVRLTAAGVRARVVIQRNSIDYLEPIRDAFVARSQLASPDRWERFLHTIARRGRARIEVDATLASGSTAVARFSGTFVASGAGTYS